MIALFRRPRFVGTALLLATFIPIMVALMLLWQIPTGNWPEDSLRFVATPIGLYAHAAGGVTFGLLGPFQFSWAMQHRFGRTHRIAGRIFVIAGLSLAVSSQRLIWHFPDAASWILLTARLAASLAVIGTLVLGVRAAMMRDIINHRAWMIRAYAIGMGAATISLIMFPIYLIRGAPLQGLLSDLAFVASWAINIAIAEWVIRRLRQSR